MDTASNGKTAQGMLSYKKYTLLLIDIKTPVMSGKELYQYLYENYPELTSRAILTSGAVVCDETQGFLESSGRPFLPKPFTPDELREIIRETSRTIGNA